MKIGIQTIGTKGDVKPYLALADGLISKGHQVRLIVASTDNKNYISGNSDLTIEHIGRKYYQSDWIKEFIGIWSKSESEQSSISLAKQFEPVLAELIASAKKLCEECDVVMGNQLQYPLICTAEKTSTPFVAFSMMHSIFPSKYLTPQGLPDLGRYINSSWWAIVSLAVNKVFKQSINKFRVSENLSPVKNVLKEVWISNSLNLIAVSSVFSKSAPDWKNIFVCGNIHGDGDTGYPEIPLSLREFFDAGAPPVYFTIGSCVNYLENSLDSIVKIFFNAAKLAGCRAIIQADWAVVDESIPHDSDIYRIDSISHKDVFPHCAIIVHHGSHGSSHMATYCGCPSIVIPYAFDQPFWAKELKKAGVGGTPLHRRDVTATTLANEIKRILQSPIMKKRAEYLSDVMKNENGVDKAVGLLENYFDKIELRKE